MTIRTTTTRLTLAIVGSLALHALVISSARLELAAPPPPIKKPLEVQLAHAPPPAAKPLAAITPARKPRRRHAAAKRRAPPIPVVTAPTPLFVTPEMDYEVTPEPDEFPVADAEPLPPKGPAGTPGPVSPAPANSPPRKGRIEYAILYGSGDGFPVGKAVQTWEMQNGQYLLASDAETTGLVDVFVPQRLRYVSQGKITPAGLRPDSFLITRTRRGKTEAARARFDWNNGQIFYGYAHERKTAELTAGAQDLMSLVYYYHFALVSPKPGRLQVPVTSGKRFETYEVEVFPEEIIDTPVGPLWAVPMKQLARPGKEHFEMWLAVRYNYLPVRIRHYDRKGAYSGEQIAVDIRVSDAGELASR